MNNVTLPKHGFSRVCPHSPVGALCLRPCVRSCLDRDTLLAAGAEKRLALDMERDRLGQLYRARQAIRESLRNTLPRGEAFTPRICGMYPLADIDMTELRRIAVAATERN